MKLPTYPMQLFQQSTISEQDIAPYNDATSQYGLSLTTTEMKDLIEQRITTLSEVRRIEFGEGPLLSIVKAFGDSPYLTQESYAETLGELQDAFYHLKETTEEEIADDDLIDAMRTLFDEKAHGVVDYFNELSPTTIQQAIQSTRQDVHADWSEQEAYEAKENDLEKPVESTRDETTRIYEGENFDRPSNEYANNFYDEAFELYRQQFDGNSRIGGSSL